jgi:antirestriction protein ArdC
MAGENDTDTKAAAPMAAEGPMGAGPTAAGPTVGWPNPVGPRLSGGKGPPRLLYGRESPRTALAQRLIEQLKEGTAPWQKPWTGGTAPPFNPVSGTCYRGVNRISLLQRGYNEPRWLSFLQAQQKGWRVRKNARSQIIEFWNWGERLVIRDDRGGALLDDKGRALKVHTALSKPRVRYYHVFNMQDVTDAQGRALPAWEGRAPGWDPLEKLEGLIRRSGAEIAHDQTDRAFYSLRRDRIHLPARDAFPTAEEYYSTLLHELAHWTQHPTRLKRGWAGAIGGEGYAREELAAEIASWMLASDLGLRYSLTNHASYVKFWVRGLEEDHHDLFKACSEAERIRAFLSKHIPGFRPFIGEPADGPAEAPGPAPAPAPPPEGPAQELRAGPLPGRPSPQDAEGTPRAALVNSFFGYLLRPGLLAEQKERWLSVLAAGEHLRGKGLARAPRLGLFLGEAGRVARLAILRMNEDEAAGAPLALREAHAHNDCLALLGFAREAGLPNLSLPPTQGVGPKVPVGLPQKEGAPRGRLPLLGLGQPGGELRPRRGRRGGKPQPGGGPRQLGDPGGLPGPGQLGGLRQGLEPGGPPFPGRGGPRRGGEGEAHGGPDRGPWGQGRRPLKPGGALGGHPGGPQADKGGGGPPRALHRGPGGPPQADAGERGVEEGLPPGDLRLPPRGP